MPAQTGTEAGALRAMMDLAPIGLARFDREGRFQYVNDRLCEMLGCTREAALRRTFQELTFPDDLDECLELTDRLANGALPRYTRDKRFVRPDGTAIWTRVTVSAVRDSTGAVQFFVGSAEDVSEQKAHAEAQRQSEERLRIALDGAAVGAFHFDVRHDTLQWSHGLDRLFGIPGARTLEDFFAAIHPDDLPRVAAAYERSATAGAPYEDEYRVVWPDGTTRVLHVRGEVTVGSDGRPNHIIGAAADITGRRGLETAIRNREAEFATLTDQMSQLAWMGAPDGSRTWCNRRWLEYTGQAMHQALGMGWLNAVDPELAGAALDSQRDSFARGEAWEHLVRLQRHDGEYRWFLTRAAPVRDAEGQVLYWLGTSTDITDRLLLEDALQQSASRLRRALEVENIGVIFFDDEHCISSVNRAFVDMSGYAESDTTRRTLWRDFTTVDGAARASRRAKEFDATGRVAPAEEEFVRPDGTRWWGLVAAKRIGPNEGVEFVLDISARKHAEQALEEQIGLEQQARQSAEFEAALREQLLGIVAHDLRNPLHTILMAADVLTDLPLGEGERTGATAVIRRSASRMARLIGDLLDASRMKSGTFSVRQGEVRAEEICAEVLESFMAQATELGLTLESHAEPGLPAFEGDADRLIQLLSNLVGNALKFTTKGGRVAIFARAGSGSRSGTVAFSVSDTGSGIGQENLSAIFDRFWQAQPGGAGAGLGLAIAKGIAEAHGGSIEVTSRIGEGTSFIVTLPVSRAGSGRQSAEERQRASRSDERDRRTETGEAEQRLR